MEREGLMRHHLLVRGAWRDSVLYARINATSPSPRFAKPIRSRGFARRVARGQIVATNRQDQMVIASVFAHPWLGSMGAKRSGSF
jgi:hypothetical protein